MNINEQTALDKVKAQMRLDKRGKAEMQRPAPLKTTPHGQDARGPRSDNDLSNPDDGEFLQSDFGSPIRDPDGEESATPSPTKAFLADGQDVAQTATKPAILQMLGRDDDVLLVADNTHEIVMQKVEAYKAELAALERKKQREQEPPTEAKVEEDGEEKKKK